MNTTDKISTSYDVVASWLTDNKPTSPFPANNFQKAIAHDLQQIQALQHHIKHIKEVWDWSYSHVREQRQVYLTDSLCPILRKDAQKAWGLMEFITTHGKNAGPKYAHKRMGHLSLKDTVKPLWKAHSLLEDLIESISSLPKLGCSTKQDREKLLSKLRSNSPAPTPWKLEDLNLTSVANRIRDLESTIVRPPTPPSPENPEQTRLRREVLIATRCADCQSGKTVCTCPCWQDWCHEECAKCRRGRLIREKFDEVDRKQREAEEERKGRRGWGKKS